MDNLLIESLSEFFKLLPDQLIDSLEISKIDSWDSLMHMEMVVMIENTFEIQLSNNDIMEMKTIGDIQRIISKARQ